MTEANKKHKDVIQADDNCFNLNKKTRKKQQQQQIIRGVFRTQSKIKDRAALTKIRANKEF